MRTLAIILALSLLSGCSSLKFNNMVKTGATTAVTYAVAGPLPAIANLAVSVGVDEVLPDEPSIGEIESKEQAVAFVADSLFMNILYGFIAFLLITTIVAPWLARKNGYAKAKAKYRKNDD